MTSTTTNAPSVVRQHKDDLCSAQVYPGAILRLPGKGEVESRGRGLGVPMDEDVIKVVSTTSIQMDADARYNHPILVISRPAGHPENIHFLILRSHSNTAIDDADKQPVRPASYQFYFPLQPSNEHPLLERDARYRAVPMAHGLQNPKSQSYVYVREVFEMDWRCARRYFDRKRPNDLDDPWAVKDLKAILDSTQALAVYSVGQQRERPWAEWWEWQLTISPYYLRRSVPHIAASSWRAFFDWTGWRTSYLSAIALYVILQDCLLSILRWLWFFLLMYCALVLGQNVSSVLSTITSLLRIGIDAILLGIFDMLVWILGSFEWQILAHAVH